MQSDSWGVHANGARAVRNGAKQAGRLDDQPMQFGEHRARPVGLVVLLVTDALHRDQSRLGKARQESAYCAGSRSGESVQLPALETPIGLAEQQAQDPLLGRR